MVKYELVNQDGCLMASGEFASDKKAREYFKSNYEGSYKIFKHAEDGLKMWNVKL